MPELPEVENARRVLERAELPGRTITEAQVGWAPTVRFPSLEDFVLGIIDRRVLEIQRKGKYILLPLDSGETFIIHLGMTGGVTVQSASRPLEPMVRHTFGLDDGRVLWFRDPRKFGHLWLTSDLDETLPPLGPEPLSPDFTVEAFASRLVARSAPIKALLLEQSIVAGLGNLYVDESLFHAGINPARESGSLSKSEVAILRDSIVKALNSAIAMYDNARHEQWPDPPSAMHTWTIPRKEGEPCPRCGASIAGLRIRGRGTFFCPSCQPGR